MSMTIWQRWWAKKNFKMVLRNIVKIDEKKCDGRREVSG